VRAHIQEEGGRPARCAGARRCAAAGRQGPCPAAGACGRGGAGRGGAGRGESCINKGSRGARAAPARAKGAGHGRPGISTALSQCLWGGALGGPPGPTRGHWRVALGRGAGAGPRAHARPARGGRAWWGARGRRWRLLPNAASKSARRGAARRPVAPPSAPSRAGRLPAGAGQAEPDTGGGRGGAGRHARARECAPAGVRRGGQGCARPARPEKCPAAGPRDEGGALRRRERVGRGAGGHRPCARGRRGERKIRAARARRGPCGIGHARARRGRGGSQ
jgi:hypothetical protein